MRQRDAAAHPAPLLGERLCSEAGGTREEAAEERHVDGVLHAAEVEEAEGRECEVALPVDVLALLNLRLHEPIREGGLGAREDAAKLERMRLWEPSDGTEDHAWRSRGPSTRANEDVQRQSKASRDAAARHDVQLR